MGPSAYRRSYDIERYVAGTEVWSLNNCYLTFPPLREAKGFTRVFELHGWDYLRTWNPGNLDSGDQVHHVRELARLDCECVVTEMLPVVKKQSLYPYVKVFTHFGPQSVYWLGSPSLMLALALYEHSTGAPVEFIQSFGIDTNDPQHAQQRSSWAWWTSKAQSLGIELSGTMLEYHEEHEKDDGLRGLREHVQGLLSKAAATAAQPQGVPA
jgi:hypothetical protein